MHSTKLDKNCKKKKSIDILKHALNKHRDSSFCIETGTKKITTTNSVQVTLCSVCLF